MISKRISVAICRQGSAELRIWVAFITDSINFDIFFIIFPREERLRQYFTTRYDSRHNIFDWDYNMKLSKNVNICCL